METPFGELPDRFLTSGMTMAEAHDYLRRRSSRRSFLRGAAVAGGAAALGPILWQQPGWAQVAPPGSPRLTFGNDPTTTMSVSWSTPAPVANPRLSFGTTDAGAMTIPAQTATVSGLKSVPTNYHQVRLTGLQPGTTYRYRLLHDGGVLDNQSFKTGTAGAHPFTFTAFGDHGVSTAGAANAARIAAIGPAFHLVAGDLCYADNLGTGLVVDALQFDPKTWDTWFAESAVAMQTSPWMPAMGNHDMEPGMGDHGYAGHAARLALPTNGFNSRVYAFRYANVGYVSVDANDVSEEIPPNKGYTGGGQTAWLDRTLTGLRADPTIDFIVVYFHHCAYCTMSSHGSDGGVRATWVPLFDRHQVDLVVNGHNHGYERTHPVHGNAPTTPAPIGSTVRSDQQGTTYITAGGGGRSPDSFTDKAFISHGPEAFTLKVDAEMEASPWSAVRVQGNSFLRADVAPPDATGATTMALTTISSAGAVVDRLVLRRQRAIAVVAPQAPASTVPAASTPAPAAPGVGVSAGHLASTGANDLDLLRPAGMVGGAALVGAAGLAALRRRGQRLAAETPGAAEDHSATSGDDSYA